MRSLVAISFSAFVGIAQADARGDGCVAVDGEPTLVAEVDAALNARGIAIDGCSGLHARVEQVGDQVLVQIENSDGKVIERTVSGAETAATVIESWVRTDVAAPLLSAHTSLPAADPPPRVETRFVVSESRGIHVFTVAETSLASDGTAWGGAQIGACIKLGPVCAAARARFARVMIGPGPFDGQLDRTSVEVLFGGDVPLEYHRITISPGAGAWYGSLHTFVSGMRRRTGRETEGLRADVHATVSFPLTRRLSFETSVSVDLTQEIDSEESMATPSRLPDDPFAFVRVGAGLRYGSL